MADRYAGRLNSAAEDAAQNTDAARMRPDDPDEEQRPEEEAC
jgi:hypothetical protein